MGWTAPGAYWGFGAWFNCAFIARFLPFRIHLLRNLHLTDRAPAALSLPQPETAR